MRVTIRSGRDVFRLGEVIPRRDGNYVVESRQRKPDYVLYVLRHLDDPAPLPVEERMQRAMNDLAGYAEAKQSRAKRIFGWLWKLLKPALKSKLEKKLGN